MLGPGALLDVGGKGGVSNDTRGLASSWEDAVPLSGIATRRGGGMWREGGESLGGKSSNVVLVFELVICKV